MEHSPSWEASSHSCNQEIFHLSWNPKILYRIHKSPSLVPNLSQINSVHTSPPCFPKIHSNIIIPSTSMSSVLSLPLRFSIQNIISIYSLSHACYITVHLILLDLIALIIFDEVYKVMKLHLCQVWYTEIKFHIQVFRYHGNCGMSTWG